MTQWFWKFLLLTGMISASSSFSQQNQTEHDCSELNIWTRKAGDYRDNNEVSRLNEQISKYARFSTKAQMLFDSQYQSKKLFKAFQLVELISKFQPSSSIDLVLLHFRNKMIIPLSLNDLDQIKDNIFVAVAIKSENVWNSEFPKIEREDPMWRDPRPIRFCGNKIVIQRPMSFKLAGQNMMPKGFTPWKYVDSLIGVEFAKKDAYYAQFNIGKSSKAKEGFQVFKNRCQFCHGAQLVGAGMGWDYAGPIPAYEKRQPDSLLLHVKYEKAEQFRLGTIMPAQPDMSDRESQVLWQWLRDVAKQKLRPYSP